MCRPLQRRAELQTVALEDIASRLAALRRLADEPQPDVAKVHETLRDLVRVFESLADNAQAFMAGVARSIELQQAGAAAVAVYKRRLIDYLERFIGDLVRRSDAIAEHILAVAPRIDGLLRLVAEREARDAAPGDAQEQAAARDAHPGGLARALERACAAGSSAPVTSPRRPSCCGRGRAPPSRSCWRPSPRSTSGAAGRSDRSADFRMLAAWFAGCASDADAAPAGTRCVRAQPGAALRAGRGRGGCGGRPARAGPMRRPCPSTRGCASTARQRRVERCRGCVTAASRTLLLAQELAQEAEQVEAARLRLATGRPTRLSELGTLDAHAFGLFLSLLGEALAEQAGPDAAVERQTGDGLLRIRLEPLGTDSRAGDPHAQRRVRRPRPSDHHHAHRIGRCAGPATATAPAAAPASGSGRCSRRNSARPCAPC